MFARLSGFAPLSQDHWNPARSMPQVLRAIFQLLNTHGVLDVPSGSDPLLSYPEIEATLLTLSEVTELVPAVVQALAQEPPVVMDSLPGSSVPKHSTTAAAATSAGGAPRAWAAGTGTGVASGNCCEDGRTVCRFAVVCVCV
jgi:hypothetical protein